MGKVIAGESGKGGRIVLEPDGIHLYEPIRGGGLRHIGKLQEFKPNKNQKVEAVYLTKQSGPGVAVYLSAGRFAVQDHSGGLMYFMLTS